MITRLLPSMALGTLLACALLVRVAADADSASTECSTSAEAKTDISLIQRNHRSGITVNVSDSPFEEPIPSDGEAHFLSLGEIGEGDSISAAQIGQWEDEADRLAKYVSQRRALLDALRMKIAQAPDKNVKVGSNDLDDKEFLNRTNVEDKLIIPVPYYMHNKKAAHFRPEQNAVEAVTSWYGNIIGDALDPTPSHGSDTEHKSHHNGHVVILFLFVSLVLGCCLQLMLDRYCKIIPYTVALFACGSLVAAIHYANMRRGHLFSSWYESVEMWQDINPHLLFYIFLPALLFGDVMKLKVQLVTRCFGQIFILACPGVILGTGLAACFGRFMLPYGWDWSICFVFGSILAATDPVAVVSLFNTLGVSPRLTMLISGESLVNDGTAIVCFALALKVAQGAVVQPLATAYFFAYMIIPSIILGFCIAFVTVALISFCSDVIGESDAMIQVVITICCGYLAFFISEHEFSSSGVVATVSAGLVVAHSAWPLFVSKETVHIVWEAIEFVGNTVIFFLAGLIFMGTVLDRHFGVQDFSWLLVLYVGMIAIRFIMLAVLWVPLNMCGQQITWQEGVVMVWSGLRGAVSLAMGMIVDIEPGIDNKTGSQVMFYVGGVAALTLLINATTTGPLLKLLGLVKTENVLGHVSGRLSELIVEDVNNKYHAELRNRRDVRFYGANAELVTSMVPFLNCEFRKAAGESNEELTQPRSMQQQLSYLNEQVKMEWQLVQVFREVFLRVVLSRYWQGIEDGVIPRQLLVSRVLLHSTEEAMDNVTESLKDWDIISRKLGLENTTGVSSTTEKFISRVVETWPFKLVPQFRRASLDFKKLMTVFVALSFIEAHTFAEEEIPLSLGRDDPVGVRVRKQVISESALQRQAAIEFVSQLDPAFVERSKSDMLARKLLRKHIHKIEEKREAGFLSKAEAEHLCHSSHKALQNIMQHSKVSWETYQSAPRKESVRLSSEEQAYAMTRGGDSQVPPVDTLPPGYHMDRGTVLQPGAGAQPQIAPRSAGYATSDVPRTGPAMFPGLAPPIGTQPSNVAPRQSPYHEDRHGGHS